MIQRQLSSLGETTSDASGLFSLGVNADLLAAGAGTYTLIATFHGSNSYGSSYAETAFTIESAPTATATASTPPNLATTADIMTYFAVGVIAIIIAIAIVGVLLLRKHP